jgi:hypothetical protein
MTADICRCSDLDYRRNRRQSCRRDDALTQEEGEERESAWRGAPNKSALAREAHTFVSGAKR